MTSVSRAALLFLSRQGELKDLATRVPPLGRLARRFVAGEELEEAIEAVRALNALGALATLDHLEEEVRSAEDCAAEVREYLRVLARIDASGVRANASIKLTQFGLGISEELALANARTVVAEAARRGNFVRVDMEGSAVTDATLRVFRRLWAEFGEDRVGVALQSYLRRTEADARALVALPARLRLCKGAYLEPPEVAFPDKREVYRNFLEVTRLLLGSGGYHAIATHDERMIDGALAQAARLGLPPDRFELQMLYGVRRDLQERLAREGYRVRVYVPYGRSWYPYFMRRLAERPANVWFVLKNLAR